MVLPLHRVHFHFGHVHRLQVPDTIEHFGSHCYALFQAGDHHGIPETTR